MSIRGKKREEYVKEWLEGKENPDIEVIPTKVEGKYIVRERVKNKNTETKDENTETKDGSQSSQSVRTAEKSEIQNEGNPEINKNPEPGIHGSQSSPSSQRSAEPKVHQVNNSDINLGSEILAQLKMLNEYKLKKLEKKAKKKEIKKVIHKEFVKNKVLVEDSDDESDTVSVPVQQQEPQKIYIQKPPPMRVRRKLNLLDRYK